MISLQDYRNNRLIIDSNEQILLPRIEELFSNLQSKEKDVTYQPLGFSVDSKRSFINTLSSMRNRSGKKTLLMSNPDMDFPPPRDHFLFQDSMPYSLELQEKIEKMKFDELVDVELLELVDQNTKIFCHAVTKRLDNVHMIPLGRDWKGFHVISSMKYDMSSERQILCYYNCSLPPHSIHWYGRIRSHIAEFVKYESHVVSKNLSQVNQRHLNDDIFFQYYNDILQSEFMICPRGCGADTYRMWDCIYLGCIPIVVKYEGYEEFTDLPILFIDDWREYEKIDKGFLLAKRDTMLHESFNYDKLKLSWWKDRIQTEISSR